MENSNGRRVPLRLITILEPKSPKCLGLTENELPVPQMRQRADINAKLTAQAEKLGVTPQQRRTAVDNGVQPFSDLKGKMVLADQIATIILRGNYHAVYVNIDGNQRKLELRPGEPTRADGLLSASQLTKVLFVMRTEVGYFKLGGLWVNPSENGESANLVLRGLEDKDKRERGGLPLIEDEFVMYVEVPD